MATYASVGDVEVGYGPVPADQVTAVETQLDRAEAQVRLVVPDLDARVADGRTDATLVTQVLAEMVAAVLRNPGGYVSSTTSRTEGPWSSTTSGTFAAGATAGTLVLTSRHRRLLGVPVTARTVPAEDPALRHPLVPPARWRYSGPGYVWPDPQTGLPTP